MMCVIFYCSFQTFCLWKFEIPTRTMTTIHSSVKIAASQSLTPSHTWVVKHEIIVYVRSPVYILKSSRFPSPLRLNYVTRIQCVMPEIHDFEPFCLLEYSYFYLLFIPTYSSPDSLYTQSPISLINTLDTRSFFFYTIIAYQHERPCNDEGHYISGLVVPLYGRQSRRMRRRFGLCT